MPPATSVSPLNWTGLSQSRIEAGRYENASEVVRAALRTLDREEREFEVRLAALRTAIDEATQAALPKHSFAHIRKIAETPPRRIVSRWRPSNSPGAPRQTCLNIEPTRSIAGAKSRRFDTSLSWKPVCQRLAISLCWAAPAINPARSALHGNREGTLSSTDLRRVVFISRILHQSMCQPSSMDESLNSDENFSSILIPARA